MKKLSQFVLKPICIMLWLLFILSNPALAHKASDSYLRLDVQGQQITGQWDIALRDIGAQALVDHALVALYFEQPSAGA